MDFEANFILEEQEEINATFELNVLNGIENIYKYSTAGLIDTYAIVLSSGERFYFDVKNGEKGEKGEPGSTTFADLTDSPYNNNLLAQALNSKINQTELNNAINLHNINEEAHPYILNLILEIDEKFDNFGDIVTHNASEFATSAQGQKADSAIQPNNNITLLNNNAGYITKSVNNLENYSLTSTYADIAFSGDYGDLSNTPENLSDFNNDENYIKLTNISATSPIAYNNGTGVISVSTGYTIPSNTQITGWNNKQDKINDLTTIRSNATNGQNAYSTIQLYGNIVTHNVSEFATSEQGAKADSALQTNDIIDNLTSTETNKALSANQGKELSTRITNLESLGRYLSEWDCTTGLAMTNPPYSPYEYKTGDYFLVLKTGATNYRPVGDEYVIGQASTTIETGNVTVGARYIYDGTVWILQSNTEQTVSFSNIAGQPTDNSNLATALNGKYSTSNPANYISRTGISASSPLNYNNSTGVISVSTGYQIPTTAQISLINNALQVGDDITNLNNNAGYISGITSSDVTTALGYTPYNSTNPNNYIARTGISATSPIAYNNGTGVISVSSGYQIPSTSQIATWNNKQDELFAGEAIDVTGDVVSVKYDNSTIKVNSSNQLYFNNAANYQTATQVSSAITSATSSFITKDVNNLTNYTTTTNLNTLLAEKQNTITASNKLSYSLLSDTPTIPTVPTNVSAFTNDAGYITSSYHDNTKQDKATYDSTNERLVL